VGVVLEHSTADLEIRFAKIRRKAQLLKNHLLRNFPREVAQFCSIICIDGRHRGVKNDIYRKNSTKLRETIDIYLTSNAIMSPKGADIMRIKEVCERTGLTDRAIRLYMENGLVSPK